MAVPNNSDLIKDSAPTSRTSSDSWVQWNALAEVLGQPHDSTNIPLSKLHQMRRDPMIGFALNYIKVPLMRAPWYIKSSDARISAFVDNALRTIYGSFILQYTNSLDFGYQAIVKRFENVVPDWQFIDPVTNDYGPVWPHSHPALIWKEFVALPPESVNPSWNDSGDFNGIEYTEGSTGISFSQDNIIDLKHALWVTNEKESVFGSLYGYPRTGYAYRPWWSYWFAYGLSDRHYEMDSDPPTVVRFPKNKDDNIDNAEIALSIGADARSGSTIVLPNELVTSDFDGKSTGHYEWSIEHLNTGGNFDAFNKRFAYLDIMKLRSVFVPENALVEGSGGTSSRNVAATMGDIFFESQAVLMSSIDDYINRYMIPQLVERNFPDFKGTVTKVTRGFSHADESLSKQLVQLIGQSNPDKLEVDVRSVLEQSGVPLLDPRAIAREQSLTAERMDNLIPDVEPEDGNAGVVDGNYVNAKETIVVESDSDASAEETNLSEFSDLLDEQTSEDRRFDSESVMSLSSEFFVLLSSIFTSIYDEFSFLLEDATSEELDDLLDSLAISDILSEYDQPVSDFISSIVESGASIETSSIGVDSTLDIESKKVKKWVDARVKFLFDSMSSTLTSDIDKWLESNDVVDGDFKSYAQKFLDDFSDSNDWRALRAVRGEVAEAYNFGTLTAGLESGCKYAIASDASDGKNLNTDQGCIDRNGKKFTIRKALKEKDHPNGTLSFRLVPPVTKLSEVVLSLLRK